MKPRFKTISMISLIIFSAVAFTGCGHWYKHKSPEEKAEWIVEEIADELELNEAQLVELNKVKRVILDARTELKESHEQHKNDINQLLEQATLDTSKLQSMVDNKLEFISSKSPAVIEALAGFYDSLTPAQQQELREEWKDKSEKHHRHHWN